MSGIAAIRGFVVQALVALLQVCNKDCRQICFEPSNKADEKVDFWWEDGNGVKYAVQVKSTKNEFTDSQVESWANALQKNHEDMVCTLVLVGTYQQSKTPLQTKVYIEIEPFDENVERYELELWKKAERGIVDLLDKRKLAIGTPTGWNRAVKWGIGEFLTKCDKPMTPENFINNLKEIVIAGTDFQHAIDRYRQKTIDDLSKRKDSVSKKLLSEMFVEQDFYDPPLSYQPSGEESPRTNCFKMVEEHSRLFILSEPGMGKSTFLNALALRYAKDAEKLLPILIRLREKLPDMDAIADAVGINHADRPAGKDFIRDMLQAGKALLILDGLDEIKVEQINKIKALIHDLNPSHCLITCRLSHSSEGAAFEQDERFKRVQMAKFLPAQICSFANKWDTRIYTGCGFIWEIDQHKNLVELAAQPLLLALLSLSFDKNRSFSQRRVDIYRDAIETLLKEWDTGRDITRNSCFDKGAIRTKIAILSAIAYENFKENRYTMTKVALKRQIEKQEADQDGKDVLDEITAHHGILVKQNNNNYAFLHLTFQEYFTALAITGNPDYQQELMQHIHDPRWREVFLVTASLQDNADPFFVNFHAAVLASLSTEPQLCQLIRWVNERAMQQVQVPEKSMNIRFAYLYLAWILDQNLAFDLNKSRERELLSFDLAKTLGNKISQNMGLAFLEAQGIATVLDEWFSLRLDHLSELACTLEGQYTPTFAADYLRYILALVIPSLSKQQNLNIASSFLQQVADLLHEWGDFELAVFLKSKPDFAGSKEEWYEFWAQLQAKLIKRIDSLLHGWSTEQLQKLANYFYANKLLLDCLDLATITDREAIRNSLFLPPEESAGGG